MKRHKWILTTLALLACLSWGSESVFARGGGGGGRGGGGGGARMGGGGHGGGGMSRPSVSHSPSMSRPAASRPSMSHSPSMHRPTQAARPSRPTNLPSGGNFSKPSGITSRPGGSTSKPSLAGNSRPGGSTFKPGGGNSGATTALRPSTGGSSRPGSNFTGGGRPSAGDLGNFLDMPKPGSGNIGGQGGSRPNFADHNGGFNRPGQGSNRPGDGSTFDNVLHNGGNRPTTLPGNVPGTSNRPGGIVDNRPGSGNRPGGIGDIRPGSGNRPGGIVDNRPGNGNYRPGDHFRPGFDNHDNNWSHNINNNWHNHWNNNNWHNNFVNINNGMYHPGWNNRYPRYRNCYWHYRPPYAYGWWTFATAATVGSWFGTGYGQPVYYDYGTGGNVYYEGDTVYINDQTYGSAQDYAASAQQLAVSGEEQLLQPPADDKQTEWLPLGVFALSTSEEEKEPTRMLQMAVNKDGVINGTMYDTESKQSQPIVGAVDKDTQRACWYIGDNKDIVAETGLYNLTQDSTSILVHYGADRTEEYLLTRLDPPAEAKQASAHQQLPTGLAAN